MSKSCFIYSGKGPKESSESSESSEDNNKRTPHPRASEQTKATKPSSNGSVATRGPSKTGLTSECHIFCGSPRNKCVLSAKSSSQKSSGPKGSM